MFRDRTYSRREFLGLSLLGLACGSVLSGAIPARLLGAKPRTTGLEKKKALLIDLSRCQECGMSAPSGCTLACGKARQGSTPIGINKVRVVHNGRPMYLSIPSPETPRNLLSIRFFKDCTDCLERGGKPSCEAGCPKGAISSGLYRDLVSKAEDNATKINGYFWSREDLGTRTPIYVSPVPRNLIAEQIQRQKTFSLLARS